MLKRVATIVIAHALILSLGMSNAHAAKDPVLPAPVKKCLDEHLPNATISQFEEQTEQGRHMFFVAAATSAGKTVTMLASGRGQYLGQLAAGADGSDDTVDIDLDSAPAPVKAAIDKQFGKTEIDGLSMEVEASRFIYVADLTTDNVTQWVSFSLQGDLVSIEREVAVKDVPPAVSKAIVEAHAQSTITSASVVDDQEKKTKQYVVDVTAGTQKLEITVSPEGKIESDEPDEDDPATAPSAGIKQK